MKLFCIIDRCIIVLNDNHLCPPCTPLSALFSSESYFVLLVFLKTL